MKLFITINRQIDSRELWEHIKDYGVNLTSLVENSYVYGEADLYTSLKIILICSMYGDLTIRLSGPQ